VLRKFVSIAGGSDACRRLPRPRADYKALDAEAARLMTVGKIPGLAYAVIENGKVVHVSAQGWRNVDKKLPLTPDTIMYAASISKAAFASTC
jgi:CubicO group peptidase (beta-lactamase class C family)